MKNDFSSANNWDGLHQYYFPGLDPELLLPANEPVKCSEFGCGRSLTLREKLFGDKCCLHSKRHEPDIIGEFCWVDENGNPALKLRDGIEN